MRVHKQARSMMPMARLQHALSLARDQKPTHKRTLLLALWLVALGLLDLDPCSKKEHISGQAEAHRTAQPGGSGKHI